MIREPEGIIARLVSHLCQAGQRFIRFHRVLDASQFMHKSLGKVETIFERHTLLTSFFSAVSPPCESCEIDKKDQQQEHQQFHPSLPFRRSSVIAPLVLSLLASLPRVYRVRLSFTSAMQRIRVAYVGVMRGTGHYRTALTLPR